MMFTHFVLLLCCLGTMANRVDEYKILKNSLFEMKGVIERQNEEISALEKALNEFHEEKTGREMRTMEKSNQARKAGDDCESLYNLGERTNGYYLTSSQSSSGPETVTVFCDFTRAIGQMTQGFRPVVKFEAVRDVSGDLNLSGGIITYDRLVIDTYSGFFSIPSGTFTAPFSGMYRFFFEGLTMDAVADTYVQYLKNSVVVEEIQVDEGSQHNSPFFSSIVLNLVAGDQMQLNLQPGGIACSKDLYLFHFAGELLW